MKKSLALLVSLILVVGLFAGCGTTDAAAKAESAPDYYAATGLYYTCLDLQAKVPEGNKNVEPWTKGVQIFAMGKALYDKGMYTESLAPLGQTKKFWSGLVEKDAPVVASNEYAAKGLYYTCLDLRGKVPEDKKNVEPWTKGVQIFAMGEALYKKAMYTDALAPLGQVVKFWSGLCK